MNKADLLAKVSIFSAIENQDLVKIAQKTREQEFHRGDVIIREGERDNRLFIITKGKAEVVKSLGERSERRVRTLGPLEYFGEMTLIDDLVRSASVVAKEETEVLYLDSFDLRGEIKRNPGIAIELLQMLSRRIRAIEKAMINTIGTFLPICSRCKKIRLVNGSWTPIDVYIEDHSEAEFSHTICEECSKELYPNFRRSD